MPVNYIQCAKIDEFLNLDVDAIVVPRLMDSSQLPKITQYIYSKADEDKIKRQYKENEGNEYCWMEHFPDFSGDEYEKQYDAISDSDPIITVTEGCGLGFKYIFHVSFGYREEEDIVTLENDPELFRELSDAVWSKEDIKYEQFVNPYAPDDEDSFILRRCYELVLYFAKKRGVRSIAFPMLGVEDNSDFLYPVAYHIAHTVPDEWLEEHAVYEKTDKAGSGHSGEYRLKDDMEIWIADLPYNIKWSFDPTPNLTEDEGLDEREKRFRSFERNLRQRIICSNKTPEKFAKDFIRDCFNDVKISHLKPIIDYDPTKFKNGQLLKPALHRVIAIAVALGLDDMDRYTLIHCAGYTDYPSSKFDFDVEDAIAAGARDFDALNEALFKKGYIDSPLTADVRGSKKGQGKG